MLLLGILLELSQKRTQVYVFPNDHSDKPGEIVSKSRRKMVDPRVDSADQHLPLAKLYTPHVRGLGKMC